MVVIFGKMPLERKKNFLISSNIFRAMAAGVVACDAVRLLGNSRRASKTRAEKPVLLTKNV